MLNFNDIPIWIFAGLAACWLAIVILHALIRWGLRAPQVIEQSSPATLGLEYSETRFSSANNKQLYGWFIPVPGVQSAPALIVLHGWGGNAETMLPLAVPLHRAGFALLFIDARSHGRSDRDTFASMPRFAEDVEHAMDWLKLQPVVDAARIGLVGHSVGAAAALLVASRRKEMALVLSIAAFMHPVTVMRRMLAGWHVPYVPLGWYVLRYVQHVIGYRFDEIAPVNTIARVTCPVMLVHGTEDATVPVEEARALYAQCSGKADRLLLVKGSHDSYDELDRQIEDVVVFLIAAMQQE